MNAGEPLPFSPAAERNQAAILEVLTRMLPESCRVLEIASGTGQHAQHFAGARPAWQWQPSDADAGSLAGIAARCSALRNVAPPLHLDVLGVWPATVAGFDAAYCANMLHISPWPACAALMKGAARAVVPGGALLIYGPFVVEGEPLAPSNAAFDASLNARNAQWGLRLLGAVVAEADAAGLRLEQRIAMPANNLLLAFRCGPG